MTQLHRQPDGEITKQVAELERRLRVLDDLTLEVLATLQSEQNQQRLIEAGEKAVEALREHLRRWWLVYASAGGRSFRERPSTDTPP